MSPDVAQCPWGRVTLGENHRHRQMAVAKGTSLALPGLFSKCPGPSGPRAAWRSLPAAVFHRQASSAPTLSHTVLTVNLWLVSPGTLTQAIRNFAKSLEGWLANAMSDFPQQVVQTKVASSSGLASTRAWEDGCGHRPQGPLGPCVLWGRGGEGQEGLPALLRGPEDPCAEDGGFSVSGGHLALAGNPGDALREE